MRPVIPLSDIDLALFEAAREGDFERVPELVTAGANPNAVSPGDSNWGAFAENLTPLMVAAGSPRSNAKTVEALLKAGSDATICSAGGVTAGWYGAGGLGFDFFNCEWDLTEGHLYANWGGGDADRLKLILDAGAPVDEFSDSGRMSVGEAAAAGDPKRLRLLLERGASVWPVETTYGLGIPLFQAAESGSLECVQLILDQHFPADYEFDGQNALHVAKTVGIAELLWEKGVRPASGGWLDPVTQAFEDERYDVAALFLSQAIRTPEFSDYMDGLLHGFSGVRMNPRAVRMLVDLGAKPYESVPEFGSTLHYACWQGENVNDRPTEEVRRAIQILVEAGANVNLNLPQVATPLHQAVAGDGDSPAATQVLIDNGAYLNALDDRGQTPLMWACNDGSLESVRLLLKAGADVNIRDDMGTLARDYARYHLIYRTSVVDQAMRNGESEEEAEYKIQFLTEAVEMASLFGIDPGG